jgi:hypothetical protein
MQLVIIVSESCSNINGIDQYSDRALASPKKFNKFKKLPGTNTLANFVIKTF